MRVTQRPESTASTIDNQGKNVGDKASQQPINAGNHADAEKQKQARARWKRLGTLGLGVLAINALLGFVLYEPLVSQKHSERLQTLTAQQAHRQAEKVQSYLDEVQKNLEQAAQLPGLAEAAATLTPEARVEQIQAVSELFPNPLAVRLIARGSAQIERDHVVPIRFAELDFIRRAERRETAYPEMVRVNDSWQLHLIHPLPPQSDRPVAGTLLTTLDATDLRRRLSAGDAQLGQTQLIQQIPGSGTQVLAQSGQRSMLSPYEVSLENSYWQVKFTPSEALIEQAKTFPATWWLLLSATTGIGLVAAWLLAHRASHGGAAVAPADPSSDEDDETVSAPVGERRPAEPLYQSRDMLDPTTRHKPDQPDTRRSKPPSAPAATSPIPALADGIFRAYDIRGVANRELTPELTEHIGKALGSLAQDRGETHMVVARDGRTHSPALTDQLVRGILQTGCHVLDLGIVPTPVMYFATQHLDQTRSGVMVTASHNPAEYNGFKMVIDGVTLSDQAVQEVRSRINEQQHRHGEGRVETLDIVPDYIDRVASDVAVMGRVSLVIDAGNAVTGAIAPRLFEALGCDVIPLHCELDGTFPNHDPDPTQAQNLRDLVAKVKETGADMGVAFDGDGDRLVVVSASGQILWPDQLLMLFARDVLTRHPGADIVFDVKCSRQLSQLITSYGGRPIMWKTGHSPMKAKMLETEALLGGEYSGHIFINERWYGFDDGLYAMARLLEIITLREQSIDEAISAFPALPCTPEIKVPVPENDKFSLIDALVERGDFGNGKATTIDGLRVDFAKGWGLVRASNTSAALTLRFEAETKEALATLQQVFKKQLLNIDNNLKINF